MFDIKRMIVAVGVLFAISSVSGAATSNNRSIRIGNVINFTETDYVFQSDPENITQTLLPANSTTPVDYPLDFSNGIVLTPNHRMEKNFASECSLTTESSEVTVSSSTDSLLKPEAERYKLVWELDKDGSSSSTEVIRTYVQDRKTNTWNRRQKMRLPQSPKDINYNPVFDIHLPQGSANEKYPELAFNAQYVQETETQRVLQFAESHEKETKRKKAVLKAIESKRTNQNRRALAAHQRRSSKKKAKKEKQHHDRI